MNRKNEMTKLLKLVEMDSADITTVEKPIIGTQALATCFGVLLYDEKNKEAIVAHVSSNWKKAVSLIFNLISCGEFRTFKYLIITGYYSEREDNYNIGSLLTKIFTESNVKTVNFIPFEMIYSKYKQKDLTESYHFAFDSRTGKFVTDKVLFGEEYLKISEEVKKEVN